MTLTKLFSMLAIALLVATPAMACDGDDGSDASTTSTDSGANTSGDGN